MIKDVDLKTPAISLHGGMLQEETSNRTDQLENENLIESKSDSDEREGNLLRKFLLIVGVTKSKLHVFSFVCALLGSSNSI